MSFIYSRALVEASSLDKCLGTEPSAPLSGNHTPKPCLWHDKTMEPSRLSRFGMTCKPLTESLGAELLTSWLAGFPVRTSALQEKARESQVPGLECGDKWPASLAKFDPVSCSWKTAQLSLLGDSEQSSVIWPRSGMTAAGQCWELPMLERPTRGTGSGFLLPTPVSIDAGSGRFNTSLGSQKKRPTLALMARKDLWPTPNACTASNALNLQKSGDGREKPNKLGWAVAVNMWPTPTAHNAKETNAPSESERNTPTLAAQAVGALSPNWVEWLMGWPIGHTDLKPLEMGKSRFAPQQHGESLEAAK